jgi:hypothetical protein
MASSIYRGATVDLDPRHHRFGALDCQTGDLSRTHLCSVLLRRPHDRLSELARMNAGRRVTRAQSMSNDRAGGKPVERRGFVSASVMVTSHETAVRGHSAIAPVVFYLSGKLGVQREAAARQSIERSAGAPIEGQKAARLARRRASDSRSLDDDNIDAAPGQEIGDASSDHAAATDQDTHLTFIKSEPYAKRKRDIGGSMIMVPPQALQRIAVGLKRYHHAVAQSLDRDFDTAGSYN